MYHDYIRTNKCLKRLVLVVGVFIFFSVFQHKESKTLVVKEESPIESASIINEQISKPDNLAQVTIQPDPQISVTAIPTPLPPTPAMESVSITLEPTPPPSDVVEPTEEPPPPPVEKNKLYYFVDNNIRTDVPVDYQNYLYDLLKDYGHEDKYELIMAMIYHESKWKPRIVSKTYDYGLMQINRCNHKWLKKTLGITDFLDPYQSIRAGVYLMCGFFDKYDDAEYALVCYNIGEGGAKKKGVTSTAYSRSVLSDMKLLVELKR